MPGTVAVVIPAFLVSVWGANVQPLTAVVGGVLVALGLALAVWTWWLFWSVGRGTLAPWDPTTELVVRGPYRYARNPMITGVGTILAGQAVFFRSWAIASELVVFVLLNAVWFPLVEEPGLRERFGDAYGEYSARVPRWLPRVRL
jgi:protein-S-isoprenylcysteine O-methyltransferase Ste14